MKDVLVLSITEDSQVGEARRAAVALANEMVFQETECGELAIVVTEVAKNILKHAQKGELILRSWQNSHENGIEIIALDRGAGMVNVKRCLEDGFSTAGSPGTGLGAIQRLSSWFDIYSVPGVGTVLVARLSSGKVETLQKKYLDDDFPSIAMGVMQLPKLGESVSGDAWAVEHQGDRHLILMADGLGSGTLAAEASREAVKIFRANAQLNPKAILEKAHTALRSTRGAAVAIAEINFTSQTVRFAGVGNVAGVIINSAERRSMVSYNGTIGHQVRKIEEFIYPWSDDRSLLIMHTDGLGTQWNLDRYPGLLNRHPSLIASVLYRDFKRDRDDVTVLVARSKDGE
jgi:anti-sigma regulatory factor (Ser/Thr protein kinase)